MAGRSVRTSSSSAHAFSLLAAVTLAALALLGYRHSLAVPLLLDDGVTIALNPSIRDLRQIATVLWPDDTPFTAGRPLLNFSFALNYAVGGTAVAGYHAFNLLVHWLAALALLGLVRRSCHLPRCAPAWSRRADTLALAAAALWISHPLLTGSVTYISQRAECLMGLFYLCALYSFARFTANHRRRWALATIAATAGAMMVKEVAVTLPAVVLLYDWVMNGSSLREVWRTRGRWHLALAGTWIMLAALMIGSRLGSRVVGSEFTPFSYLQLELKVVVDYLGLTFWPHPLVFDYGPDLPVPAVGSLFPRALLLVGVGVWMGVHLWRRRSPAAFLLAAFFVLLAPTSSVVPVAAQPMAESRLYLPLAVLCVLGVAALFQCLGRQAGWVVAALIAAFLALTVQRNHDYRQPLRLWSATIAHQPHNSRAEFYLGNAWREAGRLDTAVTHWERSLSIRDNSDAHGNLGSAAYTRGQFTDAARHFSAALRLKPHDPIVLGNLASALAELGRREEAVANYRQALALAPAFIEARLSLARVLAELGRIDAAAAELRAVLEREPGNDTAIRELIRLGQRP